MADNLIINEYLSISAAGANKDLSAKYKAVLHLSNTDLYIPVVESVDIIRDYNINQYDYVHVSFLLPLGDVIKFVYPEKDSLEITLTNYTLGAITSTRYDILLSEIDEHIKLNNYNNRKHTDLNKEFTLLSGQCIQKDVEDLNNTKALGVYKNVTVSDTILSAVNNLYVGNISVSFFKSYNIDIAPINNARKYDQIPIPNNVSISELPTFLQKNYGVYNGHLGSYYQNYKGSDTFFIYPLFRNDLILHTDNLQIILINKLDLQQIDSTYAYSGKLLKVLCSKLSGIDDVGEGDIRNHGNSIEITESNSIHKRPIEVDKDNVKAVKDNLKRINIHKKLKSSKTKIVKNVTTSNAYEQRSKVLKNDFRKLVLEWKFSNARLLRPYMGVSVLLEEDGVINTYNGVLTGVHIVTDNSSKMEVSVLSVMVSLEPLKNNIVNSSMNMTKILGL